MDATYDFRSGATTRVVVGQGVENRLPELVTRLAPDGAVVVHDPVVGGLAERIAGRLQTRALLATDAHPPVKSLEAVAGLVDGLHAAGATRRTVLVAVGGGTTTDLAGFVASIYLRGVPFLACPTTTLAMCDAALGGKNGVDHQGLKNRLGTIRQPDVVLADVDWLRTLPDSAFREGIVEVVKKAAVLDAERFAALERLAAALLDREADAALAAVAMAVQMKMSVVLADEHEGDRRRMLNFGHTIGHALESMAEGRLRHGMAVAMGMIAECRAVGVADGVADRIEALLRRIGAPTQVPPELADTDRIWQLARTDKKARHGSVPMYVPATIGKARLAELNEDGVRRALA